jgi:hypothetical protein
LAVRSISTNSWPALRATDQDDTGWRHDIVIDNSLAHGQTGDSSIVGDRSLLDGEDHGPPVIGEQRSKTCRRVEATTKGIALQQPLSMARR